MVRPLIGREVWARKRKIVLKKRGLEEKILHKGRLEEEGKNNKA